jgi:hypothetical protein
VETQRQRERAAELVGVALQLHLDSDARRLTREVRRVADHEPITQLMRRLDEVRAQLLVLSTWHRSAQVRRCALQVAKLMNSSMTGTIRYAERHLSEPDLPPEDGLEEAQQLYDESTRLLADLRATIQLG